MLGSQPTQDALNFLVEMQQEDGHWDENPALPWQDIAPWIKPGDPALQVYLTTSSAFWLGISHFNPPAFEKAVHYITGLQKENGEIPGFTSSTWIATSDFYMAGEASKQAAQNGTQHLTSKPLPEWDDLQLAWALDCLSHAGLPANDPWVDRALTYLCERQSEDGSWATEEGRGFVVATTVQVIQIFHRYHLIEA